MQRARLIDEKREQARKQAREIIESAKKEAEKEKARIIEDARQRAQFIVEGARLEDHAFIETGIRKVAGLER